MEKTEQNRMLTILNKMMFKQVPEKSLLKKRKAKEISSNWERFLAKKQDKKQGISKKKQPK